MRSNAGDAPLFPEASSFVPPHLSFPQKAVIEEQEMPPEKRIVANVGKMDAKKHLASNVGALMASNINQALGTMLDTIIF